MLTLPRQGQANHFLRAAKERIPWAIQRYVGETERLYGILDAHLADRDFIVGPGKGRYSIADMSFIGWVNQSATAIVPLDPKFPHLKAWLARCLDRPATRRGFDVPSPPKAWALGPNEPDVVKDIEDLQKVVDEAKAQYGYKYKSP